MAIIGGFFRKVKHQRFNYKPRFWNPEKEDLENRVKAAKGTQDDHSPNAVKSRISNNLRRGFKSKHRSSRTSSRRSTFMLLFIIVALVVLSYYFLVVYLPVIERMIGN